MTTCVTACGLLFGQNVRNLKQMFDLSGIVCAGQLIDLCVKGDDGSSSSASVDKLFLIRRI